MPESTAFLSTEFSSAVVAVVKSRVAFHLADPSSASVVRPALEVQYTTAALTSTAAAFVTAGTLQLAGSTVRALVVAS